MVEPPSIEASTSRGSTLSRRLPGLATLRGYRRRDVRGDLVAGLAVTALLVPQGMAYAELAGLPAVTGLYTTVMALVAYAVFGPSPILVLGPDSALAPLILATILPLTGAGGDPATAIALASAMAVIMGVICVVAGLAHLGVITELLSKPLRVGYLNGVAVVVVVSQLPKLFGFSVTAESTPARLKEFVVGVAEGRTQRDGSGDRARLPRAALRLQGTGTQGTRRAHRRGRRDRGSGRLRARRQRRRGSRAGSEWIPGPRASRLRSGRPRPPHAGGLRHGLRHARRHVGALAHLRPQAWPHGRPGSGDRRPGHGQPGGRLLSGLPGERQRLAHGRG